MEAEKMSIAFEDDYGFEYVSMHSQPIQADVNMNQEQIPSKVIGNFLCKERGGSEQEGEQEEEIHEKDKEEHKHTRQQVLENGL